MNCNILNRFEKFHNLDLGKEGNSRGLLTCTCLSPAEMFRWEKYENVQLYLFLLFQGGIESCSSGSKREWGCGGEQGGGLSSFPIWYLPQSRIDCCIKLYFSWRDHHHMEQRQRTRKIIFELQHDNQLGNYVQNLYFYMQFTLIHMKYMSLSMKWKNLFIN